METAAGKLLYFSTGPEIVSGQDIHESQMRLDGSFGRGMLVIELNAPGSPDVADRQPNVGRNGLEIVFASNRDADQVGDI